MKENSGCLKFIVLVIAILALVWVGSRAYAFVGMSPDARAALMQDEQNTVNMVVFGASLLCMGGMGFVLAGFIVWVGGNILQAALGRGGGE